MSLPVWHRPARLGGELPALFCDGHSRIPACLEASDPAKRDIYLKHGYALRPTHRFAFRTADRRCSRCGASPSGPNLVTSQVGDYRIAVYNGSSGSVQVIIDEFGYYMTEP